MNKELKNFFDNTKQLHLLLSVSLLLIIIIIVSPIHLGVGKSFGQCIIIAILFYILFKIFTETHNFSILQKSLKKKQSKQSKIQKNKDENNEEDNIDDASFIDMKNNANASYILCGFIFVLLLYLIYSMFSE
jgi:predicted ABC-type exoprotein transport system permease subunit